MIISNYSFYFSITYCNTNKNLTISRQSGLTKSYHKVVLRSYLLVGRMLAFILNQRFFLNLHGSGRTLICIHILSPKSFFKVNVCFSIWLQFSTFVSDVEI